MKSIEQKNKGTSKTVEIHTTKLHQHHNYGMVCKPRFNRMRRYLYCPRTGSRHKIYGRKP